MPHTTATHGLEFSGGSFDGTNFTFTGFLNQNYSSAQPVRDNDNSGTASSGDWFSSSIFQYQGFTINIGGADYAVFNGFGAGEFFVPHNGEISNGQVVSPISGANNSNAVVANCFAAGTMIMTPGGEVPIEDLGLDDVVLSPEGRAVSVKWIGRQTIVTRFGGEHAAMVRIQAGALGNHSDLLVTGDHGMVLDGYVINATALVNHHNIDFVPLNELPERFTVYHIETEAHDVILANGAAAETYLDMPGRAAFDNFAEYQALYGAESVISENPMPRISSPRMLPAASQIQRTRCG